MNFWHDVGLEARRAPPAAPQPILLRTTRRRPTSTTPPAPRRTHVRRHLLPDTPSTRLHPSRQSRLSKLRHRLTRRRGLGLRCSCFQRTRGDRPQFRPMRHVHSPQHVLRVHHRLHLAHLPARPPELRPRVVEEPRLIIPTRRVAQHVELRADVQYRRSRASSTTGFVKHAGGGAVSTRSLATPRRRSTCDGTATSRAVTRPTTNPAALPSVRRWSRRRSSVLHHRFREARAGGAPLFSVLSFTSPLRREASDPTAALSTITTRTTGPAAPRTARGRPRTPAWSTRPKPGQP